MRYSKVFIDSIQYELGPVIVTTAELEKRLAPLYEKLGMTPGQVEERTGITERRFWEPGFSMTEGATRAAKKLLATTAIQPEDIEALIYTGVCRDAFEPATACHVAAAIGVHPRAAVHDIANACVGTMSGIIDIANRIELGHIKAGLVVACESAREIVDIEIARMLKNMDRETFKTSRTTLTGGSGAVAILLTDGSFGTDAPHRLLGGAVCAAPEHHMHCRWGIQQLGPTDHRVFMSTDAAKVLEHGIELGKRTWDAFLKTLTWAGEQVEKVVCHQIAKAHQELMLGSINVPLERDFPTYAKLANMGSVSLPVSAAMADEAGFLQSGNRVGLLGIGSGLNCIMLGVEW